MASGRLKSFRISIERKKLRITFCHRNRKNEENEWMNRMTSCGMRYKKVRVTKKEVKACFYKRKSMCREREWKFVLYLCGNSGTIWRAKEVNGSEWKRMEVNASECWLHSKSLSYPMVINQCNNAYEVRGDGRSVQWKSLTL
jgi:hypothetical protein